DRALIPATVRITSLPGWVDSTKALMPSMLASESGSGLTWETTTTRANGARVANSRSERIRRVRSGSGSNFVLWGSAVIFGGIPGHLEAAEAHATGPWGPLRRSILRVYV